MILLQNILILRIILKTIELIFQSYPLLKNLLHSQKRYRQLGQINFLIILVLELLEVILKTLKYHFHNEKNLSLNIQN